MAERPLIRSEHVATPETLPPYTPLEGAQLRLLLSGEYIDPQKDIETTLTPDSITDFAHRDYSIIHNASTSNRLRSTEKQIQEGTVPNEFQAQKLKWVENVGRVMAAPSHREKIKKLAPFFAKIGIDVESYDTNRDGMGLYNKYFSDRSAGVYADTFTSQEYISSNTKQFVADVLSAHTKADGTVDYDTLSNSMNEYRWFAKIFGGPEVQEAIAQMIDAEALARQDKSQIYAKAMLPQADGKPRAAAANLNDREKWVLSYIWDHGKPRITPTPIGTPEPQAVEPAPTAPPDDSIPAQPLPNPEPRIKIPPIVRPDFPSGVIPSEFTEEELAGINTDDPSTVTAVDTATGDIASPEETNKYLNTTLREGDLIKGSTTRRKQEDEDDTEKMLDAARGDRSNEPIPVKENNPSPDDKGTLFNLEELPPENVLRAHADNIKRQSRLSSQIHTSISKVKPSGTNKPDFETFKELKDDKKRPIIAQMREYLGPDAKDIPDEHIPDAYFRDESNIYRMVRNWNYENYRNSTPVASIVDLVMTGKQKGKKNVDLAGKMTGIPFDYDAATEKPVSYITFKDKGEDAVGLSVSPEGVITVVVADGVSQTFMPAVTAREIAKRVARLGKKGQFDASLLSRLDAYLQTIPFIRLAKQEIKNGKNKPPTAKDSWISQGTAQQWETKLFGGKSESGADLQPQPEAVSQTKLAAVQYEPATGKLRRGIKGDTAVTIVHADGKFTKKTGGAPDDAFMFNPNQGSKYQGSGDVYEELTLQKGDLVLVHSDGFKPENYTDQISQFMTSHPGGARLDTEFIKWYRDNLTSIDDDITIAAIHHS